MPYQSLKHQIKLDYYTRTIKSPLEYCYNTRFLHSVCPVSI
ncbi:Hypothetical protein BN2458_PEG1312 [Helicobacter typhlonius]|uniref:Uncharacterized protein n=1 Tax=Helicobacter typhlonius TaxID=76936 RepID=A0A0S4PVE0_9HELI|nr:Hypothetical protein BN2458_PEG1312 [Helicobacter typhlonius]